MVLFYNLMEPPSYMRSVVDRNVAMRRMTVHDHNTENNDISIQFLYFTSRNTQYCNNTFKDTMTQYKFPAHSKRRHLQYVDYTQRTGPFIVSPECRRLSLLLTGEQPVRTSKGFSNVIYCTWAAAGGCEMFLRTVICSTFCKVSSQAPGTDEVLEGQDSKTCTKW